MTREESIKLLALIKVAYPAAYKDMDDATKRATVAMWHSTFVKVPYPIMEMALETFRRKSKFPPTVAEMYDEFKNLYYKSFEDLFVAKLGGDDAAAKRCKYVMSATSPYLGEDRAINYSVIPAAEIGLLGEGEGDV